MTDKVRSAIARNLGVSEHQIALWRIVVGSGNRNGCRSLVEAELEVKFFLDPTSLQKLGDRYRSAARNSLAITSVSPVVTVGENTGQIFVDITLLYGKETQHIFKALHQTMTVRGPQKGKRK